MAIPVPSTSVYEWIICSLFIQHTHTHMSLCFMSCAHVDTHTRCFFIFISLPFLFLCVACFGVFRLYFSHLFSSLKMSKRGMFFFWILPSILS